MFRKGFGKGILSSRIAARTDKCIERCKHCESAWAKLKEEWQFLVILFGNEVAEVVLRFLWHETHEHAKHMRNAAWQFLVILEDEVAEVETQDQEAKLGTVTFKSNRENNKAVQKFAMIQAEMDFVFEPMAHSLVLKRQDMQESVEPGENLQKWIDALWTSDEHWAEGEEL